MHPYFPQGIEIDYVAPIWSMNEILGVFFTLVFAVVMGSYFVSRGNLVVVWFVLCGMIHTFVEGYFVWNYKTIASQSTFLAELWKEYALSDSRYLTGDAAVLVIEALTCVFWGPLSFLAAYLLTANHPSAHLLCFTISLGQLYGDLAYYLTAYKEGFIHSTPHPLHFWFYFVFLNSFWIFIPLLIMNYTAKLITKNTPKRKKSKNS